MNLAPGSNKIRILVVEDHFLTRMGLRSATEAEPDMIVVAEADNGAQALALYRAHLPDVVMMDLRLPGMSGWDTIVALRAEFPQARILVLSSYAGDEDVFRALQGGAAGYLMKDLPREHLLEAIRAVHAGERYFPAGIARRLAERLGQPELTARELAVLRLIAQGMSNKEIASELGIVEGTVKAHVVNLLEKLGALDRTQAVTVAVKRGILHLD